ncbi:MAG TPA: hypothetical protein VGG25_04685 [Streptosporangiaceae bacterium]
MTSDATALIRGLAGYAARLHRQAGTGHHVASPLGAWLLLALTAPAATGPDRERLTGLLDCDPERAARIAAALLEHPHPLVGCAVAAWTRPQTQPRQARPGQAQPRQAQPGQAQPRPAQPRPAQARPAQARPALASWQAGLPGGVATGPLPGRALLDRWARDHSFGMIDGFPLEVTPAVYLVLASALATRVSWDMPFELAPASELGPASRWAAGPGQVLRTPRGGQEPGAHLSFIAATPQAGDTAVHIARARDGLLVISAAAADAAPSAVLAAAQQLGCAVAAGRRVTRRALADLPLGSAPLWRIREEQVRGGSSQDQFTAVLPAWSARTQLGLDDPGLGFGLAAHALAGPDPWQASQAAAARYTRTGFEAAAVTAVTLRASARLPGSGVRRAAELRFGQPHAVVAVATDPAGGPWHGVPVFSAWITEPDDPGGDW